MQQLTDTTAKPAAIAFARHVADLADRELGSRLIGVYLIGSLAHGGFSPRYSDIDMALVVEQPLTPSDLDRLRRAAAKHSAGLAARLSIFWTDRNFSAGRFPPLDRIDAIDHAIALKERQRVMPPRPALAEVRAYLAGEPFENWSRDAMRLSALDRLAADDRKRYLRALLYPARFLYSWRTGRISSNDEAVAFLQNEPLGGIDLDIIGRALRCRIDGGDPDILFAERSKLPKLVDACRQRIVGAAAG
jgi:predicted nucleotidyltransferase